MILLVLALAYFLLLAAAGGLWLPALQAVTLLLSLTSGVQLFIGFRQRRIAPSALLWPCLLLFCYLSLFLLPLDYLPSWMISDTRLQLQQTLQQDNEFFPL